MFLKVYRFQGTNKRASLLFSAIIEFDEQNEALKISGYLGLYWIDDYLVWTPSAHNGVEEFFVVSVHNNSTNLYMEKNEL